MMYAAFALVSVLALTLVYQFMVRPATSRMERFYEAAGPSELIFMHMNGCGWCVRFMPDWDAFASKYGAAFAEVNLTVRKIEASERAASKYKEHVRGYPTVLLIKSGGAVVKFEGERTAAGLISFVQENGISMREGFTTRLVSGGGKQMAASTKVVKNNSGSAEQTHNIGKSAGMPPPQPPPPQPEKKK